MTAAKRTRRREPEAWPDGLIKGYWTVTPDAPTRAIFVGPTVKSGGMFEAGRHDEDCRVFEVFGRCSHRRPPSGLAVGSQVGQPIDITQAGGRRDDQQ
jgi:hypothetical protein